MRGRKPLIDKPIHKKLSLPGSLVNEVEELLHDPMRGKVKYGAFRNLVAQLLNVMGERKFTAAQAA